MADFGLLPLNVHRKSDGENMSLKTTKKTKKTESITVQPDQGGKANPDRKEVTSHYSRKRFPDRRHYESTKQDDGKHCCECTKSDYGKDCECTKSVYGIQLIFKIKM